MYRVYNDKLRQPTSESQSNKEKCVECLENIMRMPRISNKYKSYHIDIEDNDFVLKYFENKNRVKLTYRQKNQS